MVGEVLERGRPSVARGAAGGRVPSVREEGE